MTVTPTGKVEDSATFKGSGAELSAKLTGEVGTVSMLVIGATWSAASRRLLQLLPQVTQQFPRVNVVKVDVEENKECVEGVPFVGVPHVRILQGGEVVKDIVGLDLQALRKVLSELEAAAGAAAAAAGPPTP